MRDSIKTLHILAYAAAFALGANNIINAGEEAAPFQKLRMKKDAPIVHDADMMRRSLLDIDRGPWKPAVNEEKARGPAATVYPLAAPAVVVVKTDRGHGTGAFIDPAGWVITNHHVIADASLDAASGARKASIFLGKLKDGFMELDKVGLPALVYKTSPEKDLALLRLQDTGKREFPALKIAKEVPAAGKECVSIGHPGSGVLWTVRSGEISGIGKWPNDMTELLTLQLSSSAKEKEEIRKLLSQAPQRKIILSNCGINFGDSGGPLVNAQGELIAVTFAMPKKGYEGTVPFAYHVHLDEVKDFLKDRPEKPIVSMPDPWPAGVYQELLDLDGDGTPDTLGFTNIRGGLFNGMLFDLKQESKVRVLADLGGNPRSTWRFRFAVHFQPRLTAFYDTDLDGKIDLIISEKEPRGPLQVSRLDKGRWLTEERAKGAIIDPLHFSDVTARDRLANILKRMAAKKS
jgi:S1-C subfamily serine protease